MLVPRSNATLPVTVAVAPGPARFSTCPFVSVRLLLSPRSAMFWLNVPCAPAASCTSCPNVTSAVALVIVSWLPVPRKNATLLPIVAVSPLPTRFSPLPFATVSVLPPCTSATFLATVNDAGPVATPVATVAICPSVSVRLLRLFSSATLSPTVACAPAPARFSTFPLVRVRLLVTPLLAPALPCRSATFFPKVPCAPGPRCTKWPVVAPPERFVEVRLLVPASIATLPVMSTFLPFPVRFTRFPLASVSVLPPCRSATLPVTVTGATAAPTFTFSPCAVVTVPLVAPNVRVLPLLRRATLPVTDALPLVTFTRCPLLTVTVLVPLVLPSVA